ncbi:MULTISPECIES: hypothetical protein [Streptomyces]|uniref:hypothetical protein n=1 Tax=Streptomyces TaxID=1883 RepID=UPI00031EF9DA|nr:MULTISPECIES: hypothetical protein [Streptomyces]MYT07855.1 hypothetical protein [Streptomyces sp. SID5470]
MIGVFTRRRAAALAAVGTLAAANGGQVACTAYYNGDEPASTRTSSQARRADPHLEPLRTVQRR